MKYILSSLILLLIFVGCSGKAMKDGTNEIADDIATAFKSADDTSSDECKK